ncbi:hypothetical protein IJ596_05820 [bacterium]|nr:hypothetical protein [bacterium]
MEDTEKMLFDKGCFLPGWVEDTVQEDQMPISQVHIARNKDLATLQKELEEIKEHIEDVKEREWHLARLLYFHNNDFAKE